ncbi:nitroreductase family protein [Ornithinibacillus halophilus]|uniref:Nitroreductase n=1 Tax=Ornithinibacillus halophilus TaxID=930117 RepID=A0A1M5F2Z6_9BACI|nr:nitroreductase family protein [Ornithinibacillus halophilus]SHF85867.1 Nitroreductase [Ornithinibacillus halophilus]
MTILLLDAIKERRSIYSFKKEEVDIELLKEIFTFGTYAPTHYMKEPWQIKLYQKSGKNHFIEEVIKSYQRIGMIKTSKDEKTLKMIDSMREFLNAIPHHALIYYEKENDPIRNDEEYAAVCAFIQNVQLAAWQYGVGVLWTITPYMYDQEFHESVGLDSDVVKIAAVLQMGFPKKVPPMRERTPIEGKLEIIT